LPEASTALDQLTAVTSHEVAEAVTDPDVNSNVNNGRLGWVDPRLGEIGDIEENNPSAFVRLADGHLVQEVGDKNDQLLSIFAPPSNLIATTTTLSGQVNPQNPSSVIFTAVITPASGAIPAGGTVDVIVNGTILGTVPVQVINGVAEANFAVQFSARGSFTFTTRFEGSSQFQGSTSNAVTVNVS
jgi:hypothetical protein